MGARDVLRSLVRGVLDAAQAGAKKAEPVAAARRVIADLRTKRVGVKPDALHRALAGTPGVESVMTAVSGGAIRMEATFRDGSSVACALFPETPRFARRGAKEIAFRVEPPELGDSRRVQSLVASISAAAAHALYQALVKTNATEAPTAFVERENDVLRVDLRTVPEIRAIAGAAHQAVLEAIDVEAMRCVDGELSFTLKLPSTF